MHLLRYIFYSFFLLGFLNLSAQETQEIKKSEIIEVIDGTTYYLHFVKKGETLYTIARAYDVTVNDIFKSNPTAQQGIAPNQILKIPSRQKVKTYKEPTEDMQSGGDYFYHIVKQKETMYGIAKKYGVTVDELKSLNPTFGDYLKEGQTIKVPRIKDHVIANEHEWEGIKIIHEVTFGETLFRIAKKYNVTVGEIKNANPGLTDNLSIGQEIVIPNQTLKQKTTSDDEVKKEEPKQIEHTVVAGETLYKIATTYAVSIESLKAANSGLTENLSIGQKIIIPVNNSHSGYIVHNSEKKDKLQNIAEDYDVSYQDIIALNPGISKKIDKGQEIKIPVEQTEEPVKAEDEDISLSNTMNQNTNCYEFERHKDKVYNVAIMIPLFLEELDSIQAKKEVDISDVLNIRSFRFVQFYEGMLMAVDSLQKKGMKLNLFVYDVDNSDEKIQTVLESSELISMDLIIGPFFSKAFSKVSALAYTYQIKIVNPLSTREEIIYNNPYVFKVQPSSNNQIDQLVSYLTKNYPGHNIVLARHNKYKYQAEVSYIRNYLNSKRKARVFVTNEDIIRSVAFKDGKNIYTENMIINKKEILTYKTDSTSFSNMVKEIIYMNDSTVGLRHNISKVRPNIVICISDEKVFSQEFLSQLNKLGEKRDITLFGLPEWTKFDNLETGQLLNLNFHCFTSSLIDYELERNKKWILDFRTRYNTEPTVNKYAFNGFDIGWYFLNALYLYGKQFDNCMEHFDIKLIQTEFKFHKLKNDGFENTYWNLGEYSNYQFKKIEQ